MSRPVPYTVRPTRTAWIDYRSGVGVDPDNRAVACRRTTTGRHVSLVELLDAAGRCNAERIYLTGPRPAARWQEAPVPPGWSDSPAGHFYDSDDPCGRWVHDSGQRVQIRRAAPWFGDVTPAVAADAWGLLARALPRVWRDDRARLFDSPTAAGQQLWALSLPAEWDGAQIGDDLAALIRSTTGQHRMEVTAACYGGCEEHWRPPGKTVPEAHYLDGRWMFAALLRELRTGDAARLTAEETDDLLYHHPYSRVRVHVRARVPDDWEHVGLLQTKHADGVHWHAPSRPGVMFDTWCDAAEWHQAMGAGWDCDVLGGIELRGNGRALDTWRDRILRLREHFAARAADPAGAAALHATRAMLVTTIGGFHSTGRERTVRVAQPSDVPAGVPFDLRPDGTAVYRVKNRLAGNAAAFGRPEITAQVWGRAHTRLVHHKGTGALAVPGADVLGMWGDALYLASDPHWPDDGQVGRLRTKGSTRGRIRRPATLAALNQLRIRIEKENP